MISRNTTPIILSIFILLIFSIQLVSAQNTGDFVSIELIKEYEKLYIINSEKVYWNDVRVLFRMEYEGALPPAYMLFLSNSIMVLNSSFYSEDLNIRENRFFKYSLKNNKLKIKFIDPRMDISRSLNVALDHMNRNRRILFVDETNKIVTYDFRQGNILFGGFYFFLD